MITVPTFFTLIRICLVPVVAGALLRDRWGIAFITFVVAALTDILDGAIARWCKSQTVLGACLDAVADKLLLVGVFGALAYAHDHLVPLWFFWVLMLKELILVGGAIVVGLETGWSSIRPTLLGKMSTFVQLCFVGWLFLCHFFNWFPVRSQRVGLVLLIVFVLGVLVHYVWIGLKRVLNV